MELPTPLPILCKSALFYPSLNENFQPPSAQASTGYSTGINIYCEGTSYSSNIYSISDATSDTGTNAKPSMFIGTDYSDSLTSEGMALCTCGTTMPTQSIVY